MITNQPVIARGDCTFEQLQTIHNKMETELGKEGAFVDAIYVCPHHTDKGFSGERPEYKCDCDCRKPKPGLLLQAAKDFNIDLSQSYMIGDSDGDVKAGENAGVKEAIRVEQNQEEALMQILKRFFIHKYIRMVINYITYDSWWDTDITIIPELVKKYHLNVFVLSPFDNCKYPQKKSDKC